MHHKRIFFSLVLTAVFLLPSAAEAAKPNVVLLLADDLGWTGLRLFWQRLVRNAQSRRVCR